MPLDVSQILNRGSFVLGETRRIRFVALLAFILSPSAAFASCGDYLTIGSGDKTSAHQDMSNPVKNSHSSQPHRAPCSGPECTRGSRDVPLAPPATGGHDEIRDSAISAGKIGTDDLTTKPLLLISAAAFPDPIAHRIFHPPR